MMEDEGIPAFLRLTSEQRRKAWVGKRLTKTIAPAASKRRPWGYPKGLSDAEVRKLERERIAAEERKKLERFAMLRARRED